jgi:hypothetical protein
MKFPLVISFSLPSEQPRYQSSTGEPKNFRWETSRDFDGEVGNQNFTPHIEPSP